MMAPAMSLPAGTRFVFTVLDDTDDSTLENVAPLYGLLKELGFRTTKTVWPLDCPEGSRNFFAAATLQDKRYLGFVHELADAGFEIASHGATMESSRRERTLEGLALIRSEFGQYPRLFCNHGQNRENLYWGSKRFHTRLLRRLIRAVGRADGDAYEGDVERSPYFWGDVCQDVVQYVRNFTFDRLNVAAVDPAMPYHVPAAPYVRYWFSTADAPDVHAFNRVVTRERLDRLEAEGGVCVLSTHFGKGFVTDGRVDPTAEATLRYLADKRGWFAPVSEVLDRLLVAGRGRTLSRRQIARLELTFLTERIRRRRAPGV
jgi:hypothetical protein